MTGGGETMVIPSIDAFFADLAMIQHHIRGANQFVIVVGKNDRYSPLVRRVQNPRAELGINVMSVNEVGFESVNHPAEFVKRLVGVNDLKSGFDLMGEARIEIILFLDEVTGKFTGDIFRMAGGENRHLVSFGPHQVHFGEKDALTPALQIVVFVDIKNSHDFHSDICRLSFPAIKELKY
jgi:hypothetical protein